MKWKIAQSITEKLSSSATRLTWCALEDFVFLWQLSGEGKLGQFNCNFLNIIKTEVKPRREGAPKWKVCLINNSDHHILPNWKSYSHRMSVWNASTRWFACLRMINYWKSSTFCPEIVILIPWQFTLLLQKQLHTANALAVHIDLQGTLGLLRGAPANI